MNTLDTELIEAAEHLQPLEAAGQILGEIASDLYTAIEVLNQAVQDSDPSAVLVALRALLERVGATADRAAYACTRAPLMQALDEWVLSPRCASNIVVLESTMNDRRTGKSAAG